MTVKSTDLISLFEQSLASVAQHDLQEVGIVIQVGDMNCKIHGLTNVLFGELLEFENGNKGIVFNLEEDVVTAFLLEGHKPVSELEAVRRTGSVFRVPVGAELFGRVINAQGKPIDGLGNLQKSSMRPIEAVIPGIVERSPINESLETGIMAIDALVPIGKGQRELIIGNRDTGKTAVVLDIVLHQKGRNVFCIYVAIGQRQANIARFASILEENGALEYTCIVTADASEPPLNRYLAPYVGCTLAEEMRDQGKDVVILYDDLSNHATAYREISLLMRRPPGREAYPGDIFYLHSRLLERAGKLARGGSITALPIVQVQSDDITAYIPTNLISITDGQIFLDTKLFNAGIRPAVNTELSVSRVGGSAQTRAMKQVTRALKLELAQYHELVGFSQFGAELDAVSQQRLNRGSLVIELLKQPQFITYTFVEQVLRLFLLRENFLNGLHKDKVSQFAAEFTSYVKSVYVDVYETIRVTQELSPDSMEKLREIAREFSRIFVPL